MRQRDDGRSATKDAKDTQAKSERGKFDALAEVFELIVDWPKRLANEGPFYRRYFDRFHVRRVADVACGTGHHAALFNAWGLDVVGADISPNMVARARTLHGQRPGLRWMVRSYDRPITTRKPFDAIICVGNSLALAPDKAVVKQALGRMLAGVRPGGVVIVQVRNIWSLLEGPCVWQQTLRTRLSVGEALIVKGMHRSGDRGFIEVLVSMLEGEVKAKSDTVELLGLEARDLEGMMRQGGAARVSIFGSYQEERFDRDNSIDLIAVAEKAG